MNISKQYLLQVLATGLSALYSDLPTSLDIPSEDWYSLERGLWATFPELVSFLRSLEFCNNVIQVHFKYGHLDQSLPFLTSLI